MNPEPEDEKKIVDVKGLFFSQHHYVMHSLWLRDRSEVTPVKEKGGVTLLMSVSSLWHNSLFWGNTASKPADAIHRRRQTLHCFFKWGEGPSLSLRLCSRWRPTLIAVVCCTDSRSSLAGRTAWIKQRLHRLLIYNQHNAGLNGNLKWGSYKWAHICIRLNQAFNNNSRWM